MSLARMQSATLSTCSSESRSAGSDSKVCVTCGTDKTPMWRANTDGQKNLCNACGVRLHREQKKAKIARSGSAHVSGRQTAGAEPDVELLPRSRSKQLPAHTVAKGLISSQAEGAASDAKQQLQRKRSWQDALDFRRDRFGSADVKESGQMELLLPRASSQQFPREWRRVASMPQPRRSADGCRVTEALSLPFSPAAIASAELDPLDPAFLASINDPCCARQDSLSYLLDASNSCLTETDSEQTFILGSSQHDEGKRMRSLDPFNFASRAGEYGFHGPTAGAINHLRPVHDVAPQDSHLWISHGASFLDI